MRGIRRAMPKSIVRHLVRASGTCAFLLGSGCHQRVASAPVQSDAATLFAAAMQQFRSGHFEKAQTQFQRLQFDLTPRDTLQAPVRFHLAESYLGQGELITAAREFRRAADDYPASPLAPVALLRLADAHSMLWRRSELDPTNGETALATLQELASRYPDSPAARIGAVRTRTLQEMFARKDYENGLFYFKRGGYDSAILYFRSLIVKYPGTAIVGDAYIKLVQAYRAINYREEREEVCAHLRQYFGGRVDVRRECGNGSPGR